MEEKPIKVYFKGDSGITNPVDIDGRQINEGDYLTWDYGDNEKYGIPFREGKDTKPFFQVKKNENGGFYAESFEIMCFGKPFFLHDFRFKYTKKIVNLF